MGVLLYDADRIPEAANVPDAQLVDSHNAVILDPNDPQVIAAAKANGIDDGWLEAARNSPVYSFIKEWGLALPLHPEYRTLAMMYYIPPLSPVVSVIEEKLFRLDLTEQSAGHDFELLERMEAARLPIRYLANLFSAGNEAVIQQSLRKMLAVRAYMRHKTVDGQISEQSLRWLAEAGLSQQQAEAIYEMTTQPTLDERFVLPPYHREMAVESWKDPLAHKGEAGFGYVQAPKRGE
jgi:nitrate reductase beta subunit